jgi:hypothetical protein
MKTTTATSLCLATLLAAGFCQRANAGLFSDNFEALVIAERAKGAPPEQGSPATYAAFDGGYIEAGDPLAGDTPPSADQVRQELNTALQSQGFQPGHGAPSLVITYYWGVLRVDHSQIRVPYGIKTNLRARIELVSTEQLGAEVENHILGQEKGSPVDMDVSSTTIPSGPMETIIQDSRQPRIFVVVSAYDYQSLAQHQSPRVVWRVKLSAMENSGEMDEVIPALITAGAPFFGKSLPDLHIAKATLSRAASVSGSAGAQPTAESINLDSQVLRDLMSKEHKTVSGYSD